MHSITDTGQLQPSIRVLTQLLEMTGDAAVGRPVSTGRAAATVDDLDRLVAASGQEPELWQMDVNPHAWLIVAQVLEVLAEEYADLAVDNPFTRPRLNAILQAMLPLMQRDLVRMGQHRDNAVYTAARAMKTLASHTAGGVH